MKYETERVSCVISNDVAHIQFGGPEVAEYGTAAELGSDLRHIADSFQFHVMLIDCAALTFLTSTVLEALVSVHLRCRRKGRQVRVVNVNALIRDLLATTHLDRIMPVYDDLEEAMRTDNFPNNS